MDIHSLLSRFKAVQKKTEWRARCPFCQPDEQDSQKWRVRIAPGDTRPVLILCLRCRRAATPLILSHYGVSTADLGPSLPSSEIAALWDAALDVFPSVGSPLDYSLLSAVYRRFLNHPLTVLQRTHRDWLARRGFDDAAVGRFFYRSLDSRHKNRIASDLYCEFRDDLFEVPGFWNCEGVPTMAAGEGLVVPSRDLSGAVCGLKVRQFAAGQAKCLLLSSSGYGGPRAVPVPHSPLGKNRAGGPVIVLEGERNADFVSCHTDCPVVAVPGVRCWRLALPVLEELQASEVILGFDQDRAGWEISLDIARKIEYPLLYARWDGAKGMDDFILKSGMFPEIVSGPEVWVSEIESNLESLCT